MTVHRQQLTPLEDGEIEIYVRSDTKKPLWQARMLDPIGKGYLTKALKTQNKAKAEKRAKDWYDEVRFKLKHNMALRTKTVPQVCALYLADLKTEVEAGDRPERQLRDYTAIIETYVKGYFGTRHVDSIKDKDIAAFKEWCRTYWTTGPGSLQKNKVYNRNGKRIVTPSRKRTTMTRSGMSNLLAVLRGMFKTAVKYDAIRQVDVPAVKNDVKRKKGDPNAEMARAAFDLQEYQRLYRFLRHWHKTGKDLEHRQRKELLKDYVLVLVNSGIRPGTESDGLCWKHISLPFVDDHNQKQISMIVSGKTGSRELVPMPLTRIYLERIKARRRAVLGEDPSPDEYVFCLPDGTPVKEDYFRQLFRKALKEAGLLVDPEGRKRVLYSCRHTYATFRILMGRVSVFTLAENMGTSVKMISDHYAHLNSIQAAAELTNRARRAS